MQMQTGPAPRQRMASWLAWTGLLEWFNVALAGWFLWYLSGRYPGFIGPFAVLGYLTLALFLIEGGGYWLVKRRRGALLAARARLWLLRMLYGVNLVLLLVFPLALLGVFATGRPPGVGDAIFGLALYLFGFGEFIHYFVRKINMRSREWRRFLRTGQPIAARFRREYTRTQREAQSWAES